MVIITLIGAILESGTLLPQVTGGTFISASTPQNASDGLISLHPDLPGFGEFRNRKDSKDYVTLYRLITMFSMTVNN